LTWKDLLHDEFIFNDQHALKALSYSTGNVLPQKSYSVFRFSQVAGVTPKFLPGQAVEGRDGSLEKDQDLVYI
jgi:hypothetical protein